MATRVQNLIKAFGKAKQADIATASASFLQFTKLNTSITSPDPVFENDAPEIGKGNEFALHTFPSHYNIQDSVEKYSTAEFLTYACAYGLGNVSETTGVYTITPLDHTTTLELPYFTVVDQLSEGGGEAIDNAYIGCAIEDFTYTFTSGPGRPSGKVNVNWVGSGKITSPSAVTLSDGPVAEHNMLSGSMTLTINGTDYVGAKTILNGSISWKNNLLLNAGFFPGSGLQNGLQIRGRLEIGARTPTFQFTARLLSTSDEYTKLIAQTTGTAVLKVQFDSTHYVQFTFEKVAFQKVVNTEADGIVAVTVDVLPMFDATNGLISIEAKCGVSGIAQ